MGANGLQYSVIDAVKKRTAPTLEGNNMRLPVKFRRSSLLTKVVVLLVVVSATVILVSQRSQIRSNQAQCQELAGQAAELQQENQNLQTGIDGLDSGISWAWWEMGKLSFPTWGSNRQAAGPVGSSVCIF